jgi:hypothetical protein
MNMGMGFKNDGDKDLRWYAVNEGKKGDED